jgi:hypothetical protein
MHASRVFAQGTLEHHVAILTGGATNLGKAAALELARCGWLVALLASSISESFSGSAVTIDGALDNWTGPWPPRLRSSHGEVPTEERRPAFQP